MVRHYTSNERTGKNQEVSLTAGKIRKPRNVPKKLQEAMDHVNGQRAARGKYLLSLTAIRFADGLRYAILHDNGRRTHWRSHRVMFSILTQLGKG